MRRAHPPSLATARLRLLIAAASTLFLVGCDTLISESRVPESRTFELHLCVADTSTHLASDESCSRSNLTVDLPGALPSGN